MPNDSRDTARPNARSHERARCRRVVSHLSARTTTANNAYTPDHLTALAAPRAAPAANRHGRQIGEGAGAGLGGGTGSAPASSTWSGFAVSSATAVSGGGSGSSG